MDHPRTSNGSLTGALRALRSRPWLTALAVLALLLGVGGAILANSTSTVTVRLVSADPIPEGSGDAIFRVALSDPLPDGQVSFTFRAVANGAANGATADVDFVAVSQTVTFDSSGPSSIEIAVPIINDNIDEQNETFNVELVDLTNTSSASVLLGLPETAVIQDDDSPTLVSLVGPAGPVSEGAGDASFVVTIDAPSPQPVSLSWQLVGTGPNPATIPPATPADTVLGSGTWVIPAGSTTRTFSIAIIDDLLPEPDEQFIVDIISVSNIDNSADALDADVTVTIDDNDGPPSLTTNSPLTVAEGGSGTITSANLETTDTEQGPAELIYTVDTAPVNGQLFLSGAPIGVGATFTQADINASALSYTHDDSETTSDGFDFTVSDGVSSISDTFSIVITPENDAPVFDPNTYTASVDEDANPGDLVTTVSASDPDTGDTLTYSITAGNTGNAFTIDPTSGEIRVANPSVLDYETTPQYELTITATDGASATATATVTIDVINVNDAPVFDPDTYTESVAEDAAGGSVVVTVSATDPDSGDTLTYSITAGNTGNAFTIDPATGEISVTDPSVLDYETTPQYVLTVTVTDDAGLTDTAQVTIDVTDANDAPVFAPDTYTESVAEDAAGGSSVVTVSATDPDTGDTLTYSITAGNTGNAFTIDPATGEISVADPSVLDYETTPQYVLTVTVTDDAGLTDTAQVTINVTDANDAPVFNPDTYTASVAEDAAGGSSVVTVSASDPDSGDTLTYSITAGNTGGAFTIDPTSGEISVTNPSVLDFETTPQYVLTVTVTDGAGLTDTAQVTIDVTNANEAPVFAPDTYTESVAEDAAGGSSVVTVSASDPDSGDTLTYSITAGNTGNAFTIDPTSGEISVTDPSVLDYETTPQYVLTVTVTDDAGLTDTAQVTINVTDANDAPVFNPDTYTASVAEDAAGGSSVVTVSATDPDTGDTLTYSITAGNTGNAFTIDPATGEISVTNPSVLDYETTDQYILTVTVTDGAGLTDTAQVTINVTNVNELPTATDDTYTTAEDTPLNEAAPGVLANDSDPDNDTLTVTAVDGVSANVGTSISITGGSLQVNANGSFTFTPDTDFSGTVTFEYTMSDGTASDTATVTITVTPVNDPPVADDDSYTTDEETTLNVSSASGLLDNDTDAEGDTLQVSAVNGTPIIAPATSVSVTTTNGGSLTVSVNGSFDYTPATDFAGTDSFTYTVSDGNGGTDTATVTITVTNINDEPVLATNAGLTVAEGGTGSIGKDQLEATDVDNTPAQLTYTLTAAPTNGELRNGATPISVGQTFTQAQINSGAISYVHNGSETTSDSFSFVVSDGSDTTPTATFNITITPVNDPPVVDANGAAAGIDFAVAYAEGDPATPIVDAALTVSDADDTQLSGVEVQISDLANAPDETLAVDPAVATAQGISVNYDAATGTLSLSGPADLANFEAVLRTLTYANASQGPGASRTITITATDAGMPAASSDPATTITITISGDDDAPTLVNNGLSLAEGASANITPAELRAEDADTPAANLVFTLTAVPTNGELLLNGAALANGQSFTQADIDAGRLSYAHNGSETTSDSFSFTLSDGVTSLPAANFTITITQANDAPVIVLTSGATAYAAGAPAVLIDAGATVSDNDSADFNGGVLSVTLSGSGAGDELGIRNQGNGAGQIGVSGNTVNYGGQPIGTFTISGSTLTVNFTSNNATLAAAQALLRNITFFSTSNFAGPRTATFTVSDGDGQTSNPASKVISFNRAPIAVDDSVTVAVDAPATAVPVLANDSDPDGDSLTITAVTQGANGTVAITGGGAGLTYQPNAGFVGTDSFTYTISDGNGGTDTATVTVTVSETAQPSYTVYLPQLQNGGAAGLPDLQVSFAVTPASPQAGQPANIAVTVTNNGTAPASNFWVDLYINPSELPEVNNAWNELCELQPCFGIAWLYTGTLQPGQSVTLNSAPQSANNPNGLQTSYSNWPGYFANGTTQLYVIVDSWNRNTEGTVRDPNGAVQESNESNNRAEQGIIVAPGTLPANLNAGDPADIPARPAFR